MAAVFLEPVQNSGGCFPPPPGYFQRVREICDEYDVLLVSDEVICAFGRLGHMFAADRYGYQPDIITCAKGLTSGYSPLGAMIATDRLFEPFAKGDASFAHGYTFGGHPVSTAVAMANLDIFEREQLNEHVRETEGDFRATLEKLNDLPIVGDVRGDGYFYGIELVKDKATKETFDDDESERLLRGLPLRRPVRGRPLLPRRRPRRPGRPARSPARRRPGALRRDREHPPRRPHPSLGRALAAAPTALAVVGAARCPSSERSVSGSAIRSWSSGEACSGAALPRWSSSERSERSDKTRRRTPRATVTTGGRAASEASEQTRPRDGTPNSGRNHLWRTPD